MIRIARNPDGTPDAIVIPDPLSVHIEDMGGGWWLRVDTASGEALVVDLWPVVTLPKRLPPWAKVKAEQLLKWIKGRVRISAMAEKEPAPYSHPMASDRAQIAALGAHPAPIPATGDVWQEVIDAEPLAELRELYTARRALGVERYSTPLQRGNGRDNLRDALEEALDLLVYLHAEHLYGEAETVRALVIRLHGRMRQRGGVQSVVITGPGLSWEETTAIRQAMERSPR